MHIIIAYDVLNQKYKILNVKFFYTEDLKTFKQCQRKQKLFYDHFKFKVEFVSQQLYMTKVENKNLSLRPMSSQRLEGAFAIQQAVLKLRNIQTGAIHQQIFTNIKNQLNSMDSPRQLEQFNEQNNQLLRLSNDEIFHINIIGLQFQKDHTISSFSELVANSEKIEEPLLKNNPSIQAENKRQQSNKYKEIESFSLKNLDTFHENGEKNSFSSKIFEQENQASSNSHVLHQLNEQDEEEEVKQDESWRKDNKIHFDQSEKKYERNLEEILDKISQLGTDNIEDLKLLNFQGRIKKLKQIYGEQVIQNILDQASSKAIQNILTEALAKHREYQDINEDNQSDYDLNNFNPEHQDINEDNQSDYDLTNDNPEYQDIDEDNQSDYDEREKDYFFGDEYQKDSEYYSEDDYNEEYLY